jgi:hypothetical protein
MSIAQPTLEDVWKLFQESDKKIKENNEKLTQEISRVSREVEKVNKELSIEVEKVNKELSIEVEKVSTSVGRLSNRLGQFIEEMVYPAAVRLFQERGIDIHEVYRGVEGKRNGEGIEIDLLVVNDGDVVAIECKSNLSIDDINEHLERLEKLKRVLPAYINKNVMGAVTGMVIPDNVAQYAYKKGLFVIGQTGEQLFIRNDDKFKAKVW